MSAIAAPLVGDPTEARDLMLTFVWFSMVVIAVAIVKSCRSQPVRTDHQLTWWELVVGVDPVRRWKQRLDPQWRSRVHRSRRRI